MKTFASFFAAASVSLLALGGCSGSSDDTDGTATRYVNLSTGETTEVGGGESAPEGWVACPDDVCPAPYACDEIDSDSCEVRPDCVVTSSPGCDPSAPGDCPASSCAGTAPSTCDPSECPSEIPAIAMICADDSVADPVCERGADGTCDYVHRCDNTCTECEVPEIAMYCPDGTLAEATCEIKSDGACGYAFVCDTVSSPSCEPQDCGPAPAIAKICPDGSSAEPLCAPDAGGACSWAFDCSGTVECTPADCPDQISAIERICDDGASAEIVCMANTDGVCDWEFVCPM